MNEIENSDNNRTTILVVYGLVFSGLLLIAVSAIGSDHHWPPLLTAFLRDVGLLLAAVMGGTIVHDELLRRDVEKHLILKVEEMLEMKVPKLEAISQVTTGMVHRRFCDDFPKTTGLKLLTKQRRNSAVYYNWTISPEPQTLFFAGRSILHRIDADVRARAASSAEEVILRRLKNSCQITVLFLDPRTNILARLANEEGEPKVVMLDNIAISLGVCHRLATKLQHEHRSLPPEAKLTIRIYDHMPYFAYHRQNQQVIIGFYFLTMEGSSSAAYEVRDPETRKVFEDHFMSIRAESIEGTLLEFDGARGNYNFNVDLFNDLRKFLVAELGEEKADQQLAGSSN
jgi:hypothetical protein